MTKFHHFNPDVCPVCNRPITVNPAKEYRVIVNGSKYDVMAHEICVKNLLGKYLSERYAEEVKE